MRLYTQGDTLQEVLGLKRSKSYSAITPESLGDGLAQEPAVAYSMQEQLEVIREGLPYDALDVVGSHANIPVRGMLELLDIPQTTYNKKKREQGLLSSRDTELVLAIAQVLDYGREVFNHQSAAFHRWLKKPNLSLGGYTPESFFDTLTGVQEVSNCLDRLEYGNLA